LMESLQSFLPTRVSSSLDVATNTLGAALGALIILRPAGRRTLAGLERWRLQHFAHRADVEWGLLIVAMWLVAQMNPAIPFFESGFIVGQAVNTVSGTGAAAPIAVAVASDAAHHADSLYAALPQAIGIALNVVAFALLVSLLLHPRKRVLLNVLLVMLAGLLAKLFMTALLFKAPQLASSLSPATLMGLSSGILAFVFFSRLSFRWRAFSAALAVFAGGVFSKITSVYSGLDSALKLFDWPYGQLANFASLTSWVNEVWPVVALVYLGVLFVRGSARVRTANAQRISTADVKLR
jgi:hypothetical protein